MLLHEKEKSASIVSQDVNLSPRKHKCPESEVTPRSSRRL